MKDNDNDNNLFGTYKCILLYYVWQGKKYKLCQNIKLQLKLK